MKLHRNAALSWRGRRELARRVLVDGWTLAAAAEAAGVSVRCARKWVGRYRLEGEQGLGDRSSAPHQVANQTPAERVAVIVALRRLRMTAAEIAETLAMPLSTVSAVLTRQGVGPLGRVGAQQPVPQERPPPRQPAPAAAFLRRAVRFYRRYGIRVERLLTDNGSAYRSVIHALACKTLAIKHLRSRPYRPQTNGKAERFIRTLLNSRAYGASYRTSHERTRALDGWLWHYNHRRRHSALGHQPPVTRTNVLGSYS